jgi:SAM-dependent methyltransferase
MNKYIEFYEKQDRENVYSGGMNPKEHKFNNVLTSAGKILNINNPKVLEIGAGNGRFQDVFKDYTGIDITENSRKYFHKNYVVVVDGEEYPFKDKEFDLIFTNAVFEHIPCLDIALQEMIRVANNKGVIVFNPSWQCRPWAANGYQVRPYSDFNMFEKIYKASIPIRENMLIRLSYVIPKRAYYLIKFLIKPNSFKEKIVYKKIKANYDIFWQSDADACNSIDPFLAILYFRAKGLKILNYPTLLQQCLVRTNELILKK